MNETRVDTMPPSFMQNSTLLLTVLEKLGRDLSTQKKG
jgi:hypothetical protein